MNIRWQHIVNAVKHEMFPMMAASMAKAIGEEDCVVNLHHHNISTDALKAVLGALKKKRALSNEEVQYIRRLVDSARHFSWNTQPLKASLVIVRWHFSGNT